MFHFATIADAASPLRSFYMSEPKIPQNIAETTQFVQQKKSPAAGTDLLPDGTPLGHYIIKKYIGGGGMGRVYLATDAALDRDVAIKLLPHQLICDQGMVARFMNEAKSAARLNHEHIAQVYFAGEESGTPFIAFEYVEGINVRTMVEEHDVFPLAQALTYLLQISHALAHAATHGVVHRDVKPSNILITREGRAKLIDMGLARLLDTSEARGDLTASGVTLGTFDYISPEQARDPRNADIRSDIYSLGCTFFYMLTGRPPFPEGTVLQKLLQHQGDTPPDIRSFQPSIPAEISFLIQKMMAKDPKQRFQTPTVLVEALTDVAQRLGLHQAGQGNLVWTPARTKRTSHLFRHLPWIMAVSLLCFGFLLTTIFLESFYQPLIWQDLPVSMVHPTEEETPVPTEPLRPVVPPFDISFVSFAAVHPAGLHPLGIGGRLLPAWEGTRTNTHVSGQLSVTDLPAVSPGTMTWPPSTLSAIRTVDPTGFTPGSYSSLASALLDAPDGTTLELRWNHALPIGEPIRLDQRNLRFVAAERYFPILLFEPSELQDTRSFFTVFASTVTFENVGIEFRHNPNVRAAHWSLFELAGATRLTFDQCFLTVRNRTNFSDTANHDDVVFFRNGTSAGGVEDAFMFDESFPEPLTITITNSLLRGEAVTVESKVPQDIHIECTHSIIALAKPFLYAEESRRATRHAVIQIHWNRVAFFGQQGVALLSKEMTDMPIIVDFAAQDSVFVLNRSPFAFFQGSRDQDATLLDFRLSGWVNNYFQGVSGLRFRTSSLFTDAGIPYEVPLSEWQEDSSWTAEMKEQTRVNVLSLNDINKPVSRYLPRDVRLLYPMERNPLPELEWFPTLWNNE